MSGYLKLSPKELRKIYEEMKNIIHKKHYNSILMELEDDDFDEFTKDDIQHLLNIFLIKDKRRLKRIFKLGKETGGKFEKRKKSGRKTKFFDEEVKICKYLRFHELGKRKDFDEAKIVLNLQCVPKSNGYFQNFKERHKNCLKESCSLMEKKDTSLFPMIFENFEQSQEFSRDTNNSSYISINLENTEEILIEAQHPLDLSDLNTEENQLEAQPPVDLSYLQEYLSSDILGDSLSLQAERNSFLSTSEYNNLLTYYGQ